MTQSYDVFVIGGGINGAAVARDAAGRGLHVGLCEKDDLAAHTSGASTKLIHGGLRYLEQGRLRLVREALEERSVLMRAAPHLVRPISFVLPHRRGMRPEWMLRAGLFLYDRLGGEGALPKSGRVALAGGPLQTQYRTGFRYSDCRVDDARLTVLTAMDAKARGADIMTRTECVAMKREPDCWALTLRREGQPPVSLRARAVVNAAGAWAGRFAGNADGGGAKPLLVKGSHIVTRRLYRGGQAYIFQNGDGRIVFAIPYEREFTLIGTTDVPVETAERGARISAEETAYLCEAVSAYFAAPVTPADVVWSFAGVRALYNAEEAGGGANPSRVSREDRLELDAGEDGKGPPVLSIFGGKLTTHRKVAERALARLGPFLPRMGAPWTADARAPDARLPDARLPGGEFICSFEEFVYVMGAAYRWAPAPMTGRMAEAYGARMRAVLGDAKSLDDLGRHFGADLYEREIAYMMAHEFARTADDVLWRRSKLGLVLTPPERSAVAEWMGA